MRRYILALTFVVVLCHDGLIIAADECAAGMGPLRFRITLIGKAAPEGASGRLFVLMSNAPGSREILRTGFVPGDTGLAAMEVEHITPDDAVSFDPDVKAYPQPFSHLKPGRYQFMALLDRDHSLPYSGEDDDDLHGPVVVAESLNPVCAKPIALSIDRPMRARSNPKENENIKIAEFASPSLSAFWGRAIMMRAGVVLPRGFKAEGKRLYPAVYHIHGYGGDYRGAWWEGTPLVSLMAEGKRMEAVHIFLDGSLPSGHHEFADSVNNGPWGHALTAEFIPWLEKRYSLIAKSDARFLTGHSSGGWSSLWVQVSYPDFFGGTWSTAPDPVDFRSFTGIDVTPGSTDNAYQKPDGSARNLVRINRKDVASFEDFARQEEVQGDYGGQLASFEWVFSPKGPDGRPMQLFNRKTGELDLEVERAWQKYDIRLILEQNWSELAPRLKGKIHVICGTEDTFHLNEAVMLLCDFFKSKHSDAVCELVPGRDHSNLYRSYTTYPDGLETRIDREMKAAFEAARREEKRQLRDASKGGDQRER